MKNIDLDEIGIILSDTLRKVVSKDISLKKATVIAKIASTISKNIVSIDLKERVELLEQQLKTRK